MDVLAMQTTLIGCSSKRIGLKASREDTLFVFELSGGDGDDDQFEGGSMVHC